MDGEDHIGGFSMTASARVATIAYVAFAAVNLAVRALGILTPEISILSILAFTCAIALYLGDMVWRGGDRAAGAVGYVLSAASLIAFFAEVAYFQSITAAL